VAELAVITPSYAPDLELCRDLNASVLLHTPATTSHYIITPQRDLALFSALRGPRTQVWSVDQLLPRHVVAVPRANLWLNLRRPFPPVRGWVMQQAVKLLAAGRVEADVLLSVDSDVVFVRPVTAETFRRDGRICFYRKDAGVDEHLPRHLIWHDVARTLLGLPRARPPLADYVQSPNVWERSTILALQDRVQQTTGRPWLHAFAAQPHVSECTLYGVFVDEVLGERSNVTPVESMRCHNYWNRSPLSLDGARQFLRTMPADDVAVMISAKSRTPPGVRRAAMSEFWAAKHESARNQH
jgi:Family of unknown function (DUF6492)